MRRRTKRKIALLVLLVLLLAFLGIWYADFRATKHLRLDLRAPNENAMEAPTFLYTFAGDDPNHLQEPIGVLADGGEVFVADGKLGLIFVFREDGTFLRTFGKGTLQTPMYIAKNPKDGNLYVTDRRKRAVFIFQRSGKFVRAFDPALPKAELPKFDTKGDQWVPVALDFAPDGGMYVLEYLNGHRMLIFGPDGKFVRSVGSTGVVKNSTDMPGLFQFPNSVKVHGKEVFVADSNNRRVQVFDLAGKVKRLIVATGLPRGIAFLPRPSNATSETTDKFIVVDTLSHDGTIFGTDGARILQFGEMGVGDGQFNYPADVSVGSKSLIFVTDQQNLRVQAWGWPQNVSPVPRILPRQPAWYLVLLPFVLIPLFRRKKRFYATSDFITAMLEADTIHTMPHKRRAWLVSQETFDEFRGTTQGDVDLSQLLEVAEHSRSDAQALQSRLEIDPESAATLAAAQRAKVFCTESADLRRAARLLDMDVVNHTEYAKRFGGKVAAKRDEAQ